MSFVKLAVRRWPAVLLCLALAGRLGAAGRMPGADEKWRQYQSPHFELYSRNSDRESRLLLHNLELVHAIFFETFGLVAVRSVPATVYFFSRDRHFEAYKPATFAQSENLAAFYGPDPDRGILTMAPLPSYEAAQQLAFGIYTFHLFRLMNDEAPAWFTYGLSGLFRNLEIRGKSFDLGKADAAQVARLAQAALIPAEALLAADQQSSVYRSNQNNYLFHDESWALVHYLYFGQHKLPRQGVMDFVEYLLAHSRRYDAAATRRALEEKLGISFGRLNGGLKNYFRNGRYGYSTRPLPDIAPDQTYAMRPVPLEEIDTRLAELAMRMNQSPLGKLAMLQALERPGDAVRALEALGSAAAEAGDWDEATDRWARARALGTANPAVLLELCRRKGRRRFQQFDLAYRLPQDEAGQLRELLRELIKVSPREPLSYELLAWVEATADQPQVANVNLVQANFQRLREKPRTLLALAVVRMRLQDKPGAAGLLDALDGAQPDDWVKYGAEFTRAQLEDRPVNPANLPSPATRSEPDFEMSLPEIRIKP